MSIWMTCTTRVSSSTISNYGFAVTNYRTGEGHFDESAKASGAATPMEPTEAPAGGKRKKGGLSKKAKTAKQRLAVADGEV
jgi:hypothetical protein